MNWLKKNQTPIYYQSNDIPYVILDDGVLLCYDNFYSVSPQKEDFSISFTMPKTQLGRANTHYYTIKKFPMILSFTDVFSVNSEKIDSIILDNQISAEEFMSVTLLLPPILRQNKIKKINSIIGKNKKVLCLYDDTCNYVPDNDDNNIISFVRSNNIQRDVVQICHHICDLDNRTCKWTQSLPDTELHTYGIENQNELDDMSKCLQLIMANNVNVIWEN